MNIFVDGRWIRTDYHDGISRYSVGIINGFVQDNIPITVLINDFKQLTQLPQNINYKLVNSPISIKELLLPHKLNKLNADIVYSPFQIMAAKGRKYKLVLTLHDTIYYDNPTPPTNLPQLIRIIWRAFHLTKTPQRILLNRADYIATVSETSKKSIENYRLTKRKIAVVYNAPSSTITPNKQRKPTKNIIYMGSFMPYKNVETLVSGMNYLPHDFILHLLSKISPKRQQELQELANKSVKLVFHNGVSDQEYKELLKDAWCLASASQEEGFGLPIIEAQSVGTPVVCSDLAIFQEVAGSDALLFNCNDAKQFAKMVLKLNDQDLRQKITKSGYEQAKKFSWKNSAETLVKLFQQLTDK